jgi:hypothetical protein
MAMMRTVRLLLRDRAASTCLFVADYPENGNGIFHAKAQRRKVEANGGREALEIGSPSGRANSLVQDSPKPLVFAPLREFIHHRI